MTTNRLHFFRAYPFFVAVFPVFFVLHGFTENYDFVPVKDALLLTGAYLLGTGLLLLVFRLIFKNWQKAALASFLLMAFNFFFGAIHDGLRKLFPATLVVKYVFILPASFILILMIFILLKRMRKAPGQITYYLNVLLSLLILIDCALLTNKAISKGKNKINTLSHEYVPCDNCQKPDVYVIIADEYSGDTVLKEIFHFDNASFINQLAALGFHTIPHSASNYNLTPYSIASTLNMDYLDLQRSGKQPLLTYTYETIRNNQLLKFLQYNYYEFYNYSTFDFKGQPARTTETFLPSKTKLLTSQTLLSRLRKEISYHLVTTLQWKSELRKTIYYSKKNNEALYQLTMNIPGKDTKHPKFVLTHLLMPHYPYYLDKNGREFPFEQLFEENKFNYHNYIEYLQYANRKLIELTDHILKNSSSPPIIILMSDHGFRYFNTPVDTKNYFSNLISVYLPGKNYSAFTDSMTNVNAVRAILNTEFRQHLPYLEDTTIFMDNP